MEENGHFGDLQAPYLVLKFLRSQPGATGIARVFPETSPQKSCEEGRYGSPPIGGLGDSPAATGGTSPPPVMRCTLKETWANYFDYENFSVILEVLSRLISETDYSHTHTQTPPFRR